MKLKAIPILAIAAFLGLSIPGCSRRDKEEGPGKSAEPSSERSKTADASGQAPITLDAKAQARIGLQTASPRAVQVNPELKGYGRVLDASPLATLTTELFTARAASDASEAELKRLRTLATQNNASARVLQGAEASAARDHWQVESARQRLTANWGTVIASRDDLPAFVQSLTSLDSVLVQIDLPAGEVPTNTPTGATVVTLANQNVSAQFISPAPAVDPLVQGQAFLFLLAPNKLRFASGTAVTGFLKLSGEPVPGVVVPESAILRHQDDTWVFVREDGTKFTRRRVVLVRPFEEGWLIRADFEPADVIVISGAQALLSEQLKSQIHLGD